MRLNEKLIQENKILEIIIQSIEKNFLNDISILTCYGSYVTGEYTKYSDIDFFFIPKTDKGYNLSYQFIINDIGYDLFPLSWDRVNKIANLEEQIMSIIMDGKVLYYSSEQDLEKYENVKKTILHNLINKDYVSEKIRKLIADAKSMFFDLNQQNNDTNKSLVYSILENLLFALALLNGKYLLKGIKNIEKEVQRFSIIPEDFLNNYNELIKFEDRTKGKVILFEMINSISILSIADIEKKKEKPNPNDLNGFYEEFKSIYNKFIQACESENYAMAVYSSFIIDKETNNLLKQFVKIDYFPEMINYIYKKNYQQLIELCKKHEKLLLELLAINNITINEFSDYVVFEKKFYTDKLLF